MLTSCSWKLYFTLLRCQHNAFCRNRYKSWTDLLPTKGTEVWVRGAQERGGWQRKMWCFWKPTQGTTRIPSRCLLSLDHISRNTSNGHHCRSGTRVSSRTVPMESSLQPPLWKSTASVSQVAMPGTSATTSSELSTRMAMATLTSESSCLPLTSHQVGQLKRNWIGHSGKEDTQSYFSRILYHIFSTNKWS